MADRKEPAEPSWAGWVAVGGRPSGAAEGLVPVCTRGPGPDGQPLQDEGPWLPGCTPGTWAHIWARAHTHTHLMERKPKATAGKRLPWLGAQ